MIVRTGFSDKRLNDIVCSSIKKMYSNSIRKPIYVSFDGRYTSTFGQWECAYLTEEYNTLPSEFTPRDREILETYHNNMFHWVTLSKPQYENAHHRKYFKSCWKWEKYFDRHHVENDPRLCWLSSVLCHELRHAWQADGSADAYNLTYRYGVKKIPDSCMEELGYEYEQIEEYDADIHAKHKCHKMLSLLKKGYCND